MWNRLMPCTRALFVPTDPKFLFLGRISSLHHSETPSPLFGEEDEENEEVRLRADNDEDCWFHDRRSVISILAVYGFF